MSLRELDKTITIIDPKTLKIVGTVPTEREYSHMLALSHDGLRGYTANVKPGSVSVLDMKGRKTIAVIPISPSTQRVSVSRDDNMAFTADQTETEAGSDRYRVPTRSRHGSACRGPGMAPPRPSMESGCWLRFQRQTRSRSSILRS